MMNIRTKHIMPLALAAALMAPAGSANAENNIARSASDSIVPFLAVGEAALLYMGKTQAYQGTKALLATHLTTKLLKITVREKRPNSESRTSFPSEHTSLAFALAKTIVDYKPKYKIPIYAAAATIGWSRVALHDHRWRDVAAGGALGYFVSKRYTGKHCVITPRGIRFFWKW